jgi:hypothetical protein
VPAADQRQQAKPGAEGGSIRDLSSSSRVMLAQMSAIAPTITPAMNVAATITVIIICRSHCLPGQLVLLALYRQSQGIPMMDNRLNDTHGRFNPFICAAEVSRE